MATEAEMDRMMALAHRVSEVLQDEKLLDVMSVCTMVIGFSILDQYENKENQLKAVDAVGEHLRKLIESGGII